MPPTHVALFGGWNGSAVVDETWIWDGSAWASNGSGGPLARQSHAMASAGGKVVLFGGMNAADTPFGDTWVFDGTSWMKAASGGPPARASHMMAGLNGKVVLFGGQGAASTLPLGDTWVFDGKGWTEYMGPGPSPNPTAPWRRSATR